MANPFVAEIRIFGFNFAPTTWAICNGQLLPISQNTALFSLLGTYYGGNGKSNFALPDLQGSIPLGTGRSTSGRDYTTGESSGLNVVTLIESEMPQHSHGLVASSVPLGGSAVPENNLLNRSPGGNPYNNEAPTVAMSPQAIAPAGGNQPHNNMMPYVTLLYCIALQGVFPPRG